MTKEGDVDHFTRVRCYREILKSYPSSLAMLSLLPIAMRMGGPKEAIWHAIIRKNYGCSHFIVGRDHAGPGNSKHGKPFYGEFEAQELIKKHEEELGIKILTFDNIVYVEDKGEYMQMKDVPSSSRILSISGTELRRRLIKGIDIPSWFTFPSVIKILRKTYPPRHEQGFTLFFTGLSGSGSI